MLCVAFYLPNVCLRNHFDLQKICVTVVARCGMLYVTNSIMQFVIACETCYTNI